MIDKRAIAVTRLNTFVQFVRVKHNRGTRLLLLEYARFIDSQHAEQASRGDTVRHGEDFHFPKLRKSF